MPSLFTAVRETTILRVLGESWEANDKTGKSVSLEELFKGFLMLRA